jgi:hypothetical protein
MLSEIAKDAVHKLVTVASSNAPMWISVPGGSLETLNVMNYVQEFPWLNSAMGQYGGHSCQCCGHARQ